MKIAYLAEGYNIHDRRFLEKMVERGHEPYLIKYHTPGLVQVDGVKTLDFTAQFDFQFSFDAIPWRRYPLFWRTARHLTGVLQTLQPDILHTGYLRWHGFIGALANFPRTLSMPWGSDVLLEPERAKFSAWAASFTLRRAQKITCDCELVRNRIVQLANCSPDKIVVFPWGIDLSIYHPRPEEGQAIRQRLRWEANDVLIMTRHFHPVYGVEYFLAALPEIFQQHPNTRVLLVGSGPLAKEFKAQVQAAGLADYVHFTGRVNQEEMACLLSAADIYVTTALSDGTSVSMLEAMACGLPLIVSDAPAYDEWISEGMNGLRARKADVPSITAKILQLLTNQPLRRQMGARNLAIARERADWEINFTKLEQIYTDLLATQSTRSRTQRVTGAGAGHRESPGGAAASERAT